METIKQKELMGGKILTQIDIGNMSKEQGERLKSKLQGKTWMDFQILVCPIGGSWHIIAETTAEAEKDDILGMFIYLMATCIY